MFKKPIKTAGQNQLSGKDKKMLRSKGATLFQEGCVDSLFSQNEKIICTKVSGTKMQIYLGQDYPLLVDGTGKDDYFPSLYVVAAYQPILNHIVINEGVENYIFNGANLMWPGVLDFSHLKDFKKDQVVAIISCKGEPIAVGAMSCSLEQFKESKDASGIAVYILHYRGDKLWEMGPKTYPQVIVKLNEELKEPKKEPAVKEPAVKVKVQERKEEGKKPVKPVKKEQSSEKESSADEAEFLNLLPEKKAKGPVVKVEKKKCDFSDEEDNPKKPRKKPQNKKIKKAEESQEEEVKPKPKAAQKPKRNQSSEKQEEKVEIKQETKPKGKGAQRPKRHQKSPEGEEEEKPNPKNIKKQIKDKPHSKLQKSSDSGEQKEKEEEGMSVLSPQYMDRCLKEAFLNALKLTKLDNELPIDSGRFYMDYMLLARGEGVKLEVKQSTYKRLGIFYEDMAKQKFIEFKAAKEKKGQQGSTITRILWDNEELSNYVPTVKRIAEKDSEEKQQDLTKHKLRLSKTLQVEYVYKLNEALRNLFFKKNYMPTEEEKAIQAPEEYLSERELKDKIDRYITSIAKKDKEEKNEEGKNEEGRKEESKKEKEESKKEKEESKKEKEESKKEKEESKKEKEELFRQKMVLIDYRANEFVYNLLKSEIQEYEEAIAKDATMKPESDEEEPRAKKEKPRHNMFKIDRALLNAKILRLASSNYQLIDAANGVKKFKEGVFKGIHIIAEKNLNKNVTRIGGLQQFIPPTVEADQVVKMIHGFAQTLQVRFASSATVQNLPGKNAGKEIIVQGNFLEDLETIFTGEYGIRRELLSTQNKLAKKKKN